MAMESPAYALLTANAALLAQVPLGRIRKVTGGDSPQRPFIVLQQSAIPANYNADRPGMDAFRVMVKCVGEESDQVLAIAGLVRDTLELAAQGVFMDGPTWEPETKSYMHIGTWRFWTAR